MMPDTKNWTGERLEPYIHNENTNEHLHRYAQALDIVSGKKVLDIACGDGYGSNLLSGLAAEVVGVDIDAETIALAKIKYRKPNLRFLTGSADVIPCKTGIFDVVVSFETIEHHDKHEEMMLEIKRVLKPNGVLIISSPDKRFYSDVPGYKNPFHVKELYADEFRDLLKKCFRHTFFLRQRSFNGSVIIPDKDVTCNDHITMYKGSYDKLEHGEFDAVYLIGIASDGELPKFKTTLFDGSPVLKKQFEAFQELVTKTVVADVEREIKSSRTYKLGFTLMKPFKMVKKLFYGA
jgi:ubiquinone/menaquinone biosynthesis C-methylase UbiE